MHDSTLLSRMACLDVHSKGMLFETGRLVLCRLGSLQHCADCQDCSAQHGAVHQEQTGNL